jgi:hypothetical protein
VTDFCAMPGQMCTPEGHLMRLDLQEANLQCDFPADDFSTFQGLTTLNLGQNPELQVSHAISHITAAVCTMSRDRREDEGSVWGKDW